ncbi:hypothetical protein ILYODFUR_033554 [Ilyodon furcidens]|uniref:Uncharacterized protein n=1 Tax=Ilyodon furcidens TaxID=33524 RepID=A0ABV0T534_9TELE
MSFSTRQSDIISLILIVLHWILALPATMSYLLLPPHITRFSIHAPYALAFANCNLTLGIMTSSFLSDFSAHVGPGFVSLWKRTLSYQLQSARISFLGLKHVHL